MERTKGIRLARRLEGAMKEEYVSLDLETTGLNPETDEITEVGAVKFRGDEVIDSFSTLINPGRRIPYFIQVLTGISPKDVQKAPSFSSIRVDLMSFIGSRPIVGQNVYFDLGFLAAKAGKLSNPFYDTMDLSCILLPVLPEHGLAYLAKVLEVSGAPCHRALDDAVAAKDVFLALLKKANELRPAVLEELCRLAAFLESPLGSLFESIRESQYVAVPPEKRREPSKALRPEPLAPTREKALIDPKKLEDILRNTIPRSFPNFEYRAEQSRMMKAVAQALNEDAHLLIEAGTGTGKSLAYLLPSLFFSQANNAPVVVSTNTINLQEQLMHKDIPDLFRSLDGEIDISKLKVVQLKGRANYLCLRRFGLLRQSQALSSEDARLLMRLLVWLESTTSGDRAELSLNSTETASWNKVCCHPDGCLGPRCQHHGHCFFHRARWAAEGANVIVVNHALLLSDVAAGSGVLPEYQHLIIDEAHNLEKEATEQLGFKVAQRDPGDLVNRVVSLASSLASSIKSRPLFSTERALAIVKDIEETAKTAHNETSILFAGLTALLEHCCKDGSDYDLRMRFTKGTRSQPIWSDIEIAWDSLRGLLTRLESKLNEVSARIDDIGLDHDDLKAELSSLMSSLSELRHHVDSVISAPDPNNVYWAQLSRQNNLVTLSAAPLHVGPVLEKQLFLQKASVILTSATLTTEGTFQHIKERLNLTEASELLVGSPFDYSAAALVYLPQDVPAPNVPAYQQSVEQVLIDLARKVEGRTLVLFTSHAALRSTLSGIRSALEKDGILAVGQGVDGSPKQLLNLLKTRPRTIVLGTSSLWEGIDVVGEALSVLVIAKLPFHVPTDPVFSARSEVLSDPFNQLALPQAVLRFKQGFGRLIRSKTDRGAVVILDRRVHSKFYGSAFLDSLPACTIKKGPACNLSSEILTWLGKGQKRMLGCSTSE